MRFDGYCIYLPFALASHSSNYLLYSCVYRYTKIGKRVQPQCSMLLIFL